MPLIIEDNKIYHCGFIKPDNLLRPVQTNKTLLLEYINDNHLIVHKINSLTKQLAPRNISFFGRNATVKATSDKLKLIYRLIAPFHIKKHNDNLEISSAAGVDSYIEDMMGYFSTKARTITRFANLKPNRYTISNMNNTHSKDHIKEKLAFRKKYGIYLHMCEGGKSLSHTANVSFYKVNRKDKNTIIIKSSNLTSLPTTTKLAAPACLRCGTTLPKELQDMLDFNFDVELAKIKTL